MSSLYLAELNPTEAVRQAREAVSRGEDDAWEVLDRTLRWRLVAHIKDGTGDPDELDQALLDAAHWANRARQSPWCHVWPYLLEILQDSDRQPGAAKDLEAIEGRAAEVLSVLLQNDAPLRPSDLAERMGVSKQQVSNLGRKLEDAGLIVRRSLSGARSTWFYPTHRAERLRERVPSVLMAPSVAPAQVQQSAAAKPVSFWHNSLGLPVSISRAAAGG